MNQLIDIWAEALLSDELPQALDGGTPKVIHWLGEIADAWLRTISPPYGAAMQVCETAGEAINCAEHVEELRDTVMTEVSKLSGVYKLIEIVVKAWQSLPESIRDGIHAALKAGAALKDLYNNPNLANLWAAGVATVAAVKELLSGLVSDIWTGKIDSTAMVNWANNLGNDTVEVVAGLLDKIGLGAVADVLREFNGAVSGITIEIMTGTTEAVDKMWQGIRRGNPKMLAEGAVDVINAPIDAGEAIIDFIGLGDAFEDAGISLSPGTFVDDIPVVGDALDVVEDIPVVGTVVCLGGLLC